jgi:DNA-binding CsgD family transcriptional regulator
LVLSFLFLGGATGLGYLVWEQVLIRLPKKHLAGIVVITLLMFAVFFAVSALLDPISVSFGAVLVNALSLWAWRDSFLSLADPDPVKKLPGAEGRNLLLRTWLSFCILALMTAFLLGNILISRRAPSDLLNARYSIVGAFALALSLLFSWRRGEGFNFLATFSLSMPFAALAFFPVLPFSIYDSSFTVVSREAWMILLSGLVILVSREVLPACRKNGNYPSGVALFGLASGYFLGAVFYSLISSTPWFYAVFRLGEGNGLAYILASGILAIVLAFFCMSMLLNKVHLQKRNTAKAHQSNNDKVVKVINPLSELDVNERSQSLASIKELTPRELEVLEILAKGNNLARVQEDLCISEGTAITHRRNIYQKLGIHSKQELIDYFRTEKEPESRLRV